MVRRSQRLKLGHARQETSCKEKNVCVTSKATKQCCREHRQKLELFCQEDEAFICVQCVPSHSSHSFLFMQKAVTVYKDKMKAALSSLESKVTDLKYVQNHQEKEIQDDVLSLEQCITQEFAKLHYCLGDDEQKLIQQLQEKEEPNILKETEESLLSVEHDTVSFPMVESDIDLKLKNKVTEAEILEKMVQHIESTEKDVLVIQKTLDSNLEPRQQEALNIVTIPITFEDIAVVFSEEEWKLLKKQDKELHREVMVQNYENMVSVGYRIPIKKLSLLFKADELPESVVNQRNVTEQKDNLHDNHKSIRSTEYSVSCRTQSSFERPELHHPIEILQDCAQPRKVCDKLHLTSIPLLHPGHSNKNPECDKGTAELHLLTDKLQQCTQPKKGYDKLHLTPVPQLHSENTCSKSSECDTSQSCHVKSKTYKCPQCSKSYTHSNNLRLHLAYHAGIKPYKCAKCDKCFTQNGCLIRHQFSHTGIKPYKCTECDKCFIEKRDLIRHQNSHKGIKPYKCTECDKSFTQKIVLIRHQISHTGIKPYKCAECDKCFQEKCNLIRHQYSHTGIKPYKCAECDKCFAQKGCLIRHQYSHTGVKPYKCAECGKCFSQRSSVIRHQHSHTGNKPYKCAECGKCFAQRDSLIHHQYSHAGIKPYKCADCDKCFTGKMQLKYHQNAHSGERPYKCLECSKSFTSPRNLQIHLISHREVKPYKCAECNKCFKHSSSLRKHQAFHT
ncbi:zinc finger protein 2-like [Protopterus annectens]|uniref:zinc finger protein 2-like n=1 Tax=Protopterus annectens TaxID=7888 RepID=UPI001CFA2745|nr:zinc finger protein 2-like [Protopterus annectens]